MGTMLIWSVFSSVTRPLLSHGLVVRQHPPETLVRSLVHTTRLDRNCAARCPFEPSAQLLDTTRRAVPAMTHSGLIGNASAFATSKKPDPVVRVPSTIGAGASGPSRAGGSMWDGVSFMRPRTGSAARTGTAAQRARPATWRREFSHRKQQETHSLHIYPYPMTRAGRPRRNFLSVENGRANDGQVSRFRRYLPSISATFAPCRSLMRPGITATAK